MASRSRKRVSKQFRTPVSASTAKPRKRRPKLDGDSKRQFIIPFFILIAVVFVDQMTKIWAVNNLQPGDVKQVLGTFFQLKLSYNVGGAMGTSLGGGTFYLITSLIILAVVLYLIVTGRENKIISGSMAAIAGGAIGNIIDRIRLGQVVDFLDFDFFHINLLGYRLERWWTFNVADAGITVGLIIICIYWIFFSHAEKEAVSTTDISSRGVKEA